MLWEIYHTITARLPLHYQVHSQREEMRKVIPIRSGIYWIFFDNRLLFKETCNLEARHIFQGQKLRY